MSKREEAINIARIYLKFFRGKFRYNLFSLKNIERTKWWSSFMKSASFFEEKGEKDPYEYIEFLFDNFEKPLPFSILYNKNWDDFLDYRETKIQSNDLSIAKSIVRTYNEILLWTKKNNYSKIAIYEFFSDPKNFTFLKRGRFSPYFLSISKSFMIKYLELDEEEKEEIISEHDLKIKRVMVRRNKKLNNKLEEVLGDEYIG